MGSMDQPTNRFTRLGSYLSIRLAWDVITAKRSLEHHKPWNLELILLPGLARYSTSVRSMVKPSPQSHSQTGRCRIQYQHQRSLIWCAPEARKACCF